MVTQTPDTIRDNQCSTCIHGVIVKMSVITKVHSTMMINDEDDTHVKIELRAISSTAPTIPQRASSSLP